MIADEAKQFTHVPMMVHPVVYDPYLRYQRDRSQPTKCWRVVIGEGEAQFGVYFSSTGEEPTPENVWTTLRSELLLFEQFGHDKAQFAAALKLPYEDTYDKKDVEFAWSVAEKRKRELIGVLGEEGVEMLKGGRTEPPAATTTGFPTIKDIDL